MNHEAGALSEAYNFRLYIAGQTPKSMAAVANLKRLCDEHLQGRYNIEVVDLVLNPQRARTDQVVAIPTLIRHLPEPVKRIIGDLSNAERVLLSIGLTVSRAEGAPQ